jgi:hypothetical protein
MVRSARLGASRTMQSLAAFHDSAKNSVGSYFGTFPFSLNT